ncbi:hypothetical protein J4558_00095 [Leptolyngbya sp. 15MV]|nr:hypothetical protein J4558_00095 [Leptolyngbya sp. 15MV]
MPRTHDYQRARVYRWENDTLKYLKVMFQDWPDAQKEAARIWRCSTRLDMPSLHDGRGCRRATGSSWRVSLPTWARSNVVITHELAHALAQRLGLCDGHGPRWAAIYLAMLDAAGIKAAERGMAEARDMRVDVDAELLERRLAHNARRAAA